MSVALRCESGRGRPYVAGLRAAARRLMSFLGLAACELSVVIADDGFVQALNRDFRGKDRATDVLSFPQLEEVSAGRLLHKASAGTLMPDPESALGDVVISVDTACRQARRMRLAPAARIRTLLVHGVLHLLGFDHERSPAEARRMFARERELAAALRRADRESRRRRQRARAGSRAAAPFPARKAGPRGAGAVRQSKRAGSK